MEGKAASHHLSFLALLQLPVENGPCMAVARWPPETATKERKMLLVDSITGTPLLCSQCNVKKSGMEAVHIHSPPRQAMQLARMSCAGQVSQKLL